MKHRHLKNHDNFTPAAIDDYIYRGSMQDWKKLRDAVKKDPTLVPIVKKVCLAYTSDPYQQRYHLWLNYVEKEFA